MYLKVQALLIGPDIFINLLSRLEGLQLKKVLYDVVRAEHTIENLMLRSENLLKILCSDYIFINLYIVSYKFSNLFCHKIIIL